MAEPGTERMVSPPQYCGVGAGVTRSLPTVLFSDNLLSLLKNEFEKILLVMVTELTDVVYLRTRSRRRSPPPLSVSLLSLSLSAPHGSSDSLVLQSAATRRRHIRTGPGKRECRPRPRS